MNNGLKRLGLLVLAPLLLAGCATPALMKVGLRQEEAAHVSYACADDQAIRVEYEARILRGAAEVGRETRWVCIPKDELVRHKTRHETPVALASFAIGKGSLPARYRNDSQELPIKRLTPREPFLVVRPLQKSMLVVRPGVQEGRSDLYYLGPDGRGGEILTRFSTVRETRDPLAYLLIAPALPFALAYDSVAAAVGAFADPGTR